MLGASFEGWLFTLAPRLGPSGAAAVSLALERIGPSPEPLTRLTGERITGPVHLLDVPRTGLHADLVLPAPPAPPLTLAAGSLPDGRPLTVELRQLPE